MTTPRLSPGVPMIAVFNTSACLVVVGAPSARALKKCFPPNRGGDSFTPRGAWNTIPAASSIRAVMTANPLADHEDDDVDCFRDADQHHDRDEDPHQIPGDRPLRERTS